jgi:hypothetical protein
VPDITNDLLIQQLYVTYLGRPADPPGLAYWKSVLENGASITSIANFFSTSSESISINSGTSEQRIGQLYKNAFARQADFDGLMFWANLLNSGQMTFTEIAQTFASSAQGNDKAAFEARVSASISFTNSIDTPAEISALSNIKAAQIVKDWFASIVGPFSREDAISQLNKITKEIK